MMAPTYLELKYVGHEDGGGAVRRADDGDGGRVGKVEAEKTCHAQGEEDAELGRRAEKHHFRVGEQGGEVDHGPDADEQEQGEKLVGDAGVKQDVDSAHLGLPGDLVDLGHGPGEGEVHQDRAEAHGHQEGGLHLLDDSQVDEDSADGPHHRHLPGQLGDVAEKTQ